MKGLLRNLDTNPPISTTNSKPDSAKYEVLNRHPQPYTFNPNPYLNPEEPTFLGFLI